MFSKLSNTIQPNWLSPIIIQVQSNNVWISKFFWMDWIYLVGCIELLDLVSTLRLCPPSLFASIFHRNTLLKIKKKFFLKIIPNHWKIIIEKKRKKKEERNKSFFNSLTLPSSHTHHPVGPHVYFTNGLETSLATTNSFFPFITTFAHTLSLQQWTIGQKNPPKSPKFLQNWILLSLFFNFDEKW